MLEAHDGTGRASDDRTQAALHRFEEAALTFEGLGEQQPAALPFYNAACAWTRAGETERALSCLERAAAFGGLDPASARVDPDLEPLHGHTTFEAIFPRTP